MASRSQVACVTRLFIYKPLRDFPRFTSEVIRTFSLGAIGHKFKLCSILRPYFVIFLISEILNLGFI